MSVKQIRKANQEKPKVVKPKSYECLIIIDNKVAEEPRAKLVDKFAKMTEDSAIKVDKWGLKKFAVEINHKKDGYYYLFTFKALPSIPRKMADLMNITDGIVRFMFVCKDDQKTKKKKKTRKPKQKIEEDTK